MQYVTVHKFDVQRDDVTGPSLKPGDMKEFLLKKQGFAALSSADYVIEVNLYRSGIDGYNEYCGIMPHGLCWGATLEQATQMCGESSYQEDVPDQDTYYAVYDSTGRRLILAFARTSPRSLKAIRIQAMPSGARGHNAPVSCDE